MEEFCKNVLSTSDFNGSQISYQNQEEKKSYDDDSLKFNTNF